MDKKEFQPQELIEHKGQTFRRLGTLQTMGAKAVFSVWFLHPFPEEENPELTLVSIGYMSGIDKLEGRYKDRPLELTYYSKLVALFFYEGPPSKYHCPSEHISLN